MNNSCFLGLKIHPQIRDCPTCLYARLLKTRSVSFKHEPHSFPFLHCIRSFLSMNFSLLLLLSHAETSHHNRVRRISGLWERQRLRVRVNSFKRARE